MSINIPFTEEVKTRCKCGRFLSVGYFGYNSGEGTPAALHALPPCAAYQEMDLLEYLEYLNRCEEN